MLANFFGKSKPVNFIIIIVLFFTYYVLDFFLAKGLDINFSDLYQFLLISPLFLILFFFFNFVISKNRLTKDNSYAFLLFVIGLGFLESLVIEYLIVIEYILLFLFLRRAYSLRALKSVYQKLFDSGFWLGILFLFSPFHLFYLLLLYAAVLLFVKVTIRTMLIPILGLLVPVFLCFTYLFWIDDLASFYQLFNIVFELDLSFYFTNYYKLFLSLFIIFILVSVVVRTGKIISVSNKFKRSWLLLIGHFLISILIVSFIESKNGSELIAFLIPSTIIIANWIQFIEKKVIIDIVLAVFLIFSLAIHFIV